MVPSGGTHARRIRACCLLVTLVAAAMSVSPATASTEPIAVEHGIVLVGRPAPGPGLDPPTCVYAAPSAGCGMQHGIDAWVIQVPLEWRGQWFWAAGADGEEHYDLQVYFYDARDDLISERTGNNKDEMGHIPTTATSVVIMSYYGSDVRFSFTVCSCQ